METDQRETCGCCSGGVINLATGRCEMCGQKVKGRTTAKTREKPKPVKTPNGGHGNRHERHKRRCCRLARG